MKVGDSADDGGQVDDAIAALGGLKSVSPIAKIADCAARTTAAAAGLMADRTSTVSRTAVVIQAANRGPRTST